MLGKNLLIPIHPSSGKLYLYRAEFNRDPSPPKHLNREMEYDLSSVCIDGDTDENALIILMIGFEPLL